MYYDGDIINYVSLYICNKLNCSVCFYMFSDSQSCMKRRVIISCLAVVVGGTFLDDVILVIGIHRIKLIRGNNLWFCLIFGWSPLLIRLKIYS